MGSDPHGLLILGVSVAALLVGPGIHRVARREPLTMAALDNFVLVVVAGLVALEILPGSLDLAGLPALLALLVGVLGPALADGPLHRASRGTHRAALALAILGMALHSFTDGLALASAHAAGGRSHALEAAVIAHQLPVAVAVWWLLSPAGPLRASAAMLLLGVATVLGFVLADSSLDALAPAWLGLLQGLFAGLLLHVIAHRTAPHAHHGARARVAAGLGGLGGLGLLALLARDVGHAHDAEPLARMLPVVVELARGAAPALLLALALVAVFAARSAGSSAALRRGPPLIQSARGLAHGLARPRPADPPRAYRRLLAGGAPATAALAALVAAPALGLDALLISLPLLGGGLTLARALGGLLLALLIGRVVGVLADRRPPDLSAAPRHHVHDEMVDGPGHVHADMSDAPGDRHDHAPARHAHAHTPHAHARRGDPGPVPTDSLASARHVHADDLGPLEPVPTDSLAVRHVHADDLGPLEPVPTDSLAAPGDRLRAALSAPFALLDVLAPWLVLGLLLAATLAPWLDLDALRAIPPAAQVPLFALLGAPAQLCAAGFTPLVAVLLARGLTPGAALAFLLTAAATSLATAGLLTRVHGRRVALLQVGLVLLVAVALGLVLDALAPDLARPALAGASPPGLVGDLALAVLAALCLASFLRQTPQQFLRRLWSRDDLAPHTHAPARRTPQ